MKPVPVALLIAAALFNTHIPLSVCRPWDFSVVDDHDYKKQLNEVFLRAGDSIVYYSLAEKLLQYLQHSKPTVQRSIRLGLGLGDKVSERGIWQNDEGSSQMDLETLYKRNEEPPISIDLTFHLLRNMIEMARIENQREQAELNRKFLDEVGK